GRHVSPHAISKADIRRLPEFFQAPANFRLITKAGTTISRLPKVARACGCPPDLGYGEKAGMVPGPNRSSRFNGHPMDRGHLEATTVRAFLVSAGCPKTGVTEEAHLHCRQCGAGLPIQS